MKVAKAKLPAVSTAILEAIANWVLKPGKSMQAISKILPKLHDRYPSDSLYRAILVNEEQAKVLHSGETLYLDKRDSQKYLSFTYDEQAAKDFIRDHLNVNSYQDQIPTIYQKEVNSALIVLEIACFVKKNKSLFSSIVPERDKEEFFEIVEREQEVLVKNSEELLEIAESDIVLIGNPLTRYSNWKR